MSCGHHVEVEWWCRGKWKLRTFNERHWLCFTLQLQFEYWLQWVSFKLQDNCSESKTTWKAVRVILEYVVFLHDAIGVGLFVMILLIMLRRGWNAGGEAAHLQRRPYEDGE